MAAMKKAQSASSVVTAEPSSGQQGAVTELPWGSVKILPPSLIDPSVKPGEFVVQTLLVEFMASADKKIQSIMQEPVEKLLSKSLQRGEDVQFDQLITALYSVSEYCLPSVLKALFAWYDYQNRCLYLQLQQKAQQNIQHTQQQQQQQSIGGSSSSIVLKIDLGKQNLKGDSRVERDFLLEKKGLAVDFIFCLVLIEILKQMSLHPGYDDLVNHVVQLAFKQFRYKESNFLGISAANVHCIADLFAEVVGVLAQSRFYVIKKKFSFELNELKGKENTQDGAQHIVSLFMGMKFFRVKMVPIEEFEVSMNFLHELGAYFLEAKDREIKHALAGLFVEILIPVAANVKTEVNVPSVKNFVDLLYAHTLDWAAKRKHSLAFYPLLTCLLCISQKQFFLTNWHYFLTMCLSNLKNKDTKMARVALESLYRLLWVYVVRIKCESNTATQSRLQSICNSLFPKGGRYVVPRDTPLNLFVKILHFIAQERLDFAFKEVIFDLLCVGRPIRTIYPERMNIGLRALLVIADSLQQCDGPPPMPKTINILPSGNTLRVKRTYLTKPLTVEIARTIGIDAYYGPCLRSFEGMLRTLDAQVGRPLMMTVVQNIGRETDDILGGERKPKLDLFRTCIAAIPRVLPENTPRPDVIDLLVRLTVHVDDELRALACQTLQNIVVECLGWREDIIYALLQFITKEIHDSHSQILDGSLRLLHQLLLAWKNAFQQTFYGGRKGSANCVLNVVTFPKQPHTPHHVKVPPVLRSEGCAMVLHSVEGLALVMLCQCRPNSRRLAVNLMKEVRQMLPVLCCNEDFERSVIDVLDSSTAYVVEKYAQNVSQAEKLTWPPSHQMDFSWAVDKIPSLEWDAQRVNLERGNEYFQWDPWAVALSGFLEPQFLLTQCPTAISYAWPAAHTRISAVFTYVDPNNPQNDTRASLLRSSKSKTSATGFAETLNHSSYLSLWEKYLVFACGVAPPNSSGGVVFARSISPLALSSSSDPGDSGRQLSELRIPRVANVSATHLFRQVLPLLRCEMADMRDLVVLGLGSVNPSSFECLLEELTPFLREAAERKQENVRRKKRKDMLRLQLVRLLEMVVFRRTLCSPMCRNCVDPNLGTLKQNLLDLIDNSRLYLELDHDREQQMIFSLHLHFAKFIASLIDSFPVEKRVNLMPNDLRKNLFYLFASWSGRLGLVLDRSRQTRDRDNLTSDECFAVAGMCAVLTCGPVFDSNAISDDRGYIFGWMDALIGSHHEKINILSEETLILLLDYNSDNAHLLEWIVDKCFTSSSRIADKCFRALVTVFSSREYPCDFIAMLNLTLMYAGYPVTETQQYAVDLLQILCQRYFVAAVVDEAPPLNTPAPPTSTSSSSTNAPPRFDCAHSVLIDDSEPKDSIDKSMTSSTLCYEQWDFEKNVADYSNPVVSSMPGKSPNERGVADYGAPLAGSIPGRSPNISGAPMSVGRDSPMSSTNQSSTGVGLLDGDGFSKSQFYLSQHLATLHPEITLQIFSEISLRACTAKPARRASMLHYMLPWLHNVELVDPFLEPLDRTFTLSLSAKMTQSQNIARRVLRGEGWGSQQATEMVLNNLTYLTVKFGNEHASLLENLWAALTSYWPNNLRVILRYLMVMCMLAPDTLITYTKRVIVYIAHVNPERLVEELMNELQTIDIFRSPVERSELPPFYRWVRRPDFDGPDYVETRIRGIIHTRRHTPSDPEPLQPLPDALPELDLGLDLAASMTSLATLTAENLNERCGAQATILEIDEQSPQRRKEFMAPFQLPLPAYGGHYCPVSDCMPPTSHALVMIHRSNLAIVLLTDLVISDANIEWTVHLPLLLHSAVLGLDHSKSLVSNHCRQLLINLIVTNGANCMKSKDMAMVLLSRNLGSQLSLQSRSLHSIDSGILPNGEKFGSISSRTTDSISGLNHSSVGSFTPTLNIGNGPNLPGGKNCVVFRSDVGASELIVQLTDLLASKKNGPLWNYEDITARNWRIQSCEQLSNLVVNLCKLFAQLLPNSKIETRWLQTALHVALCCSNRHYAGRSFQIMRALKVPLTSRMQFDVLSRLVETATELGEDMQGYVTEIMLTLDSNVLQMEVAEHSLANLFKEGQLLYTAVPQMPEDTNQQNSPTHHRSVSHSMAMNKKSEKKDWRSSVNSIDENLCCNGNNMPRSKSAHAFRVVGSGGQTDEHVVGLSQLLWISVSMMESDYEHEYLLAVRLFEKIIDLNTTERQDCFDRLERMVKQLAWVSFPGLLPLILKGCTFVSTYEPVVQILSKLLLLLDWPVLKANPENSADFAPCVAALMPYMLLHFDDPTKLCMSAAENIAEFCVTEFDRVLSSASQQPTGGAPEHPLQLLAIIMRQYAKRTFSKDCFQWTKCVVLYLNDVFNQAPTQILIFLTEILDKGPAVLSTSVLQIMFCVFQHVDLTQQNSTVVINGDFLKIVSKHVQGANWREASRILKLAVTRSSTFAVPQQVNVDSQPESEMQRKELPGRTMEFSLDVSSVVSVLGHNEKSVNNSTSDGSPRKILPGLETLTRRATICSMTKVREHLLSLLNASGLRIGLPKSPSVIFSQSSHDVVGELPSSVYSSSGELTAVGERAGSPSTDGACVNRADVTSDTYAPVFKEFDFLEGEQDSISESAESCFNWLATMRPRSISGAAEDDRSVRPGATFLSTCATSVAGDGAVAERGLNTQATSDSSDDEEESVSSQPDEDNSEGALIPESDQFLHEIIPIEDRVPTPASLSICGSLGTPSMVDLSSQFLPGFNLECPHHATGQVDEIWHSAIAQVPGDLDGSHTSFSTLIFAQLYKEACSKMCSLVRDACHFLFMTSSFREISNQFSESLHVLMRVADCPFIFVTAQMLQMTGMLQRQKYYLLELREHYETFQEKRQFCIKCLNSVKSTLKLQLMDQRVGQISSADQEVELCKSLHKLFFQLLMMCESYTKMIQYFMGPNSEQASNLTPEIQTLQRDMLRAVNEMCSGKDCLPPAEFPGPAHQRLIQMVQVKDCRQSILQLRGLRVHQHMSENLGCCEEVDIEVLLLLFCKLASETRHCFAIIGSESLLAENCNQLMETNVNLSTSVRALNDLVRNRFSTDGSEC